MGASNEFTADKRAVFSTGRAGMVDGIAGAVLRSGQRVPPGGFLVCCSDGACGLTPGVRNFGSWMFDGCSRWGLSVCPFAYAGAQEPDAYRGQKKKPAG